MLGSPFDLSKEIAAIAARRAPDLKPKNEHSLVEPATARADSTAHGKTARRDSRLPTAISLDELV